MRTSLSENRNNTKELIVANLISPVLDLKIQFAILDTVPNDNVVEGVVVPMVEDHIVGSSLWKQRQCQGDYYDCG